MLANERTLKSVHCKRETLAACVALCALLFFIGSGCQSGVSRMVGNNNEIVLGLGKPRLAPYWNLIDSCYSAADVLAKTMAENGISCEEKIIVSTFVNLNDFAKANSLGRLIAEQISSRLTQHAFKIVEVRLRNASLKITEGSGEFMLSRELKNIGASNDASYVLVGTYTWADNLIFVSSRIVETIDNTVVASTDHQLVYDAVTAALMK